VDGAAAHHIVSASRNTTGAEATLGARGERALCHRSPRLWPFHASGIRRALQPNAVAVGPLRVDDDPNIRALDASRRYPRRVFRCEGYSDRRRESHGQTGE
jgi:hypothetical protein